MSCQNAIATQIRAQGGDHMPGLKGNQGALRMNLFEQEASPTLQLAQKRRKTAWNDDYRAKVVFGS